MAGRVSEPENRFLLFLETLLPPLPPFFISCKEQN
jgi:hypothetical protein